MIAADDTRHGSRPGYHAGCRRGACPLPEQRDCTHAQSVYIKRWRLGHVAPVRDSTGAKRRLQALSALGWPHELQARELGVSASRIGQLASGRARITAANDDAIRRLYDRLSMKPGPSRKGRLFAEGRGWVTPLAWDDDTIDDPTAKPYRRRRNQSDPKVDPPTTAAVERADVDEVIVERCLRGERVPRVNPAERAEVARRWTRLGGSIRTLDSRLGWNLERDQREAAAHDDQEAAA